MERHSFEYVRHGTLSLFAAFEVGTGTVTGQPRARHTSADFRQFLDTLVAPYGARREIHVILERKLVKYIKLYNKTCRPFTWTYRDPSHRIPAIKI